MQAETIASGTLIVLGLLAGYMLHLDALHNALMFAAALIAGTDIATRALISLRNRYISIELLVTIATVGALVIGEVWEAATVSNIHQNLAIALVTVAVLLVGVLLEEVHMAGGMLIHQASVLVVIINGMRLFRQ